MLTYPAILLLFVLNKNEWSDFMERRIKGISEMLRSNNFRLTPQRKIILEVLLENENEHLNAEEIYKAAQIKLPALGLATVYRTLELFAELGIINRLQLEEEFNRYEFKPDSSKHTHHHLICVNCGKIQEFNEDLLDELEKLIEEESGFIITDHSLRFYGYCRKCRSSK